MRTPLWHIPQCSRMLFQPRLSFRSQRHYHSRKHTPTPHAHLKHTRMQNRNTYTTKHAHGHLLIMLAHVHTRRNTYIEASGEAEKFEALGKMHSLNAATFAAGVAAQRLKEYQRAKENLAKIGKQHQQQHAAAVEHSTRTHSQRANFFSLPFFSPCCICRCEQRGKPCEL